MSSYQLERAHERPRRRVLDHRSGNIQLAAAGIASAPVTRRSFLAAGVATAAAILAAPLARAQDGGEGDVSAQLAIPFRPTTDLNLREGPGTSYRVLAIIPEGAFVTGSDQISNGFRRVSYNGTLGWASNQYLSETNGGSFDPGPIIGTRVTTVDLNLRTGPTQLHDVSAIMPEGSTVEITAMVADGYRFVYYQGRGGFAFDGYLGYRDAPQEPVGTATTTTAVNFRIEPSTSARVIQVLSANTKVSLLGGTSNGFRQVSYNGNVGWVYAEFLTSSSGPSGSARVTADLNLRKEPNTGSQVFLVMPEGSLVALTDERANGFRKVKYQNTAGWAHEAYLKVL